MNNYIRKLFGVMFQSQQTQQVVHTQSQHSPTSPEEWREHWQAKGFPWRTEPEIGAKRQEELTTCRTIVPDVEKGIYPFKGVKLSRADVEWLLATHENGRGPVIWDDKNQRARKELDLRGADLQGANLNLLPLACTNAGFTTLEERRKGTKTLFEGVSFSQTHLEGVNFKGAELEGVNFQGAYLEGASLHYANLKKAHINGANLNGAYFTAANLEEASFNLSSLEGTKLYRANVKNANFYGVSFDVSTGLNDVSLSDSSSIADIHWNGVDLTVANWSQKKRLGDEKKAQRTKQLDEYQKAARANRQLATILQDQGLSEEGAYFAYRAQILQRKVFWKQRELGRWLFSALLALLAGYGYRIERIFVAYLIIVLLCAGFYYILGMYYEPHLSFLEAVLTSITAFHGRVFSEPFLRPGEPQLWVTAFEAVAGLVIEGVFIAMLTQKFFGK